MQRSTQGRVAAVVMAAVILAATPAAARETDLRTEPTLYMVAASHLDTQWWWTIQETITDLIPATFDDTFTLFEEFPDYRFSWEGAFRYMLLREYYPDLWDELLTWVAAGRWTPGGSSVDAGDVNVPSPESLVRQFLYGQSFFRRELGVTSLDVFLPDCFGFGWALPTVAAHCGLKGFSTQKLPWGSIVDTPFDIGVWKGVDGSSLVAALNPHSYAQEVRQDLSHSTLWQDAITRQEEASGLKVAYGYYGVGDRGGAPDTESVQYVTDAMSSDGPIQVLSATSDQLFRDLTAEEIGDLPVYHGELIMTQHGTGAYTSQAAMKLYNRTNELLADAAERAAVVADWLGALPYPREKLTSAWIRFLWHQFHDDLTGTGIPEIYTFSWNDELIAHNELESVLTASVGAVARALDTEVEGVPLVVYNPLSIDREDVVRATVHYTGGAPTAVRVYGPDGEEVPSQMVSQEDGAFEILFLAEVPALGFGVFDVRSAPEPSALATGLSVDASSLENERYRVSIDANGDVASIYDKAADQELLSAPARFLLFDDMSITWPAWEIGYDTMMDPPRTVVGDPAQVEIVESGPVRVALEITRTADESTFVQRVVLAAGGADDQVRVETRVLWRVLGTLLKAEFPLAVSNPEASYDLGVGVIDRPNNTRRRYEVPAQQWADLSVSDGSYGVSLMTDCKYGWDKPPDDTLRLTLLHTPVSFSFNQLTMDIGNHDLTYALYGHTGDWRNGTTWQAARLNQPLLAFQTTRHPGSAGRELGLLELNTPQAAVRAVKLAEDSDEVIVRVFETRGEAAEGVQLRLLDGIASAREVNGAEEALGAAVVEDGALSFDLRPFSIRTFALDLAATGTSLDAPTSRAVALPFDTDVVSSNDARGDGAFDAAGHTLPAELLPPVMELEGVRFELGSTEAGAHNAVGCNGQTIPIVAEEGEWLYLLAAAEEDTAATFSVGEESHELQVQGFTGFVGQWDNRVLPDGGLAASWETMIPAYLKTDRLAWVGTHRHRPEGDDAYVFTYLYRYALPVPAGATTLVLPEEPSIRLLAATLADNPAHEAVAASPIYLAYAPPETALLRVLPTADLSPAGDGDVGGAEQRPADAAGEDDATATDDTSGAGGGSGGGGCAAAPPTEMLPPVVLAALVALVLAWRRRRTCARGAHSVR